MSHQRAAFGYALALAACLIARSAAAQSARGCDYFEDEWIHTLCQKEIGVSGSVADQDERITRPLNPPITGISRTNQTTTAGEASVSVTPLSWLQVSLSSVLTGYDMTQLENGATGHGRPINSTKQRSGNDPGETSGKLLANVYDSGRAPNRFVVNIYGEMGFVPGQTDVHANTIVAAGAEFGDRMVLGHSHFSLDTLGSMTLEHGWYGDLTYFTPELHVRLSNYKWGVAAGPLIYTNILVAQAPNSGPNPNTTFAGGEILLQPFRHATSSILQAMTIHLTAVHSIGDAYWDSNYNGKVSSLVVTGTIGLQFIY
jgi:hypothetical protein